MNDFNHLIAYFREYDLYDKMFSNEIKDRNARDILLDDCNFSFLYKNMTAKKAEKIFDAVKPKLSAFTASEVKGLIQDYVHGNLSLESLFQSLPFKSRRFLGDPKQFVNDVLQDNSFQLYYPVFLNRTKRIQQPMLTFSCVLLDDSFQINKVFVNKEILTLLIAQQQNMEAADVRSLCQESIDAFTSAVESAHASESFQETYAVICGEYKHIFDRDMADFNYTHDWQVLKKALVSFEPPDSAIENCFRDELNTLERYFQQDQILPDTVRRYLGLSQANATDISSVDFSSYHWGSYQSVYSVNRKQWECIQLSKQSTLLCVEGPPGTGKTTLLKELIADTLVQKADALLSVWDQPWEDLGAESKEISRSPLLGKNLHSIVISSTNNKAIDNIGLELLNEIPFFHDFIASVKGDASENTGILCARLGKSDHIQTFYTTYFNPFCAYLESKEISDAEIVSAKKDYVSLHAALFQLHKAISTLRSLRQQFDSVSSLEALEDASAKLSAQAQQAAELIKQYECSVSTSKHILSEYTARSSVLQQNLDQQLEIINRYNQELHKLYADLSDYEEIGPLKRTLRFLFPGTNALLKKYGSAEHIRDLICDRKSLISDCQAKIDYIKQSITDIARNQDRITAELSGYLSRCSALQTDLQTISRQEQGLSDYQRCLGALSDMLNVSVPELIRSEVYTLYHLPAVRTLRNKLFLSSLRLFEVYICAHKVPILKNLRIFLTEQERMDGRGCYYRWCGALYNGDSPYSESRAGLVRTLWETFFLCFPVITTTLHSFRKSTFQLIPDLFDTVMFDESGQIVPYYALAPLYRARRAIFVGDVHQIEPIQNVPPHMLDSKFTDLLGKEQYKQFCLDQASAQSYASAASDYYEIVGEQAGGVLLNEHRRCEASIMSFSNQYVYNEALELTRPDDLNKLFGNNLIAFDIRGYKAAQHFNQAEINACKEIVDLFVKTYGEEIKQKIGIITPFNRQAAKLRETIPGVEVGTVHIFQGDEKDYILFSSVIDNASKDAGLSRFIGGKGNLLNVAFSRAKKQFIYVGNLYAARNANNYLDSAVKSISAHGSVFSLFDTDLLENDAFLSDPNILHILAGRQTVDTHDEIGQYLHEKIPHGIIDSPKLHNEILNNLLAMSKHRFDVISPWIGDNVVSDAMLAVIREKIAHEIPVHIIFGYKAVHCSLDHIDELVNQDIPWRKENTAALIRTLKDLLGNMLQFSPPSHVKLLLVDDQYLFIGSLNWLYNSGKTKQKEISCLITNPDTIRYVKEQYLS